MSTEVSELKTSARLFKRLEVCLVAEERYFEYDSAVGIATGYGLDDQGVGVQVPVGSRIFSSPSRPDWLWGLPNSN
jgi:hypothetical protein